jgi:hypothetical protein
MLLVLLLSNNGILHDGPPSAGYPLPSLKTQCFACLLCYFCVFHAVVTVIIIDLYNINLFPCVVQKLCL